MQRESLPFSLLLMIVRDDDLLMCLRQQQKKILQNQHLDKNNKKNAFMALFSVTHR